MAQTKQGNSHKQNTPVPTFLNSMTQQLYLIMGQIGKHLLLLISVLLFAFVAPLATKPSFKPVTPVDTIRVDKDNIYVSDNAKLLEPKTKKQILKVNQKFKKLPNKPQLMVITVEEIPRGISIEKYTNEIANSLGVGSKDSDSGVVYLIAKKNRQARLEVGYGMEETIPDAMTNEITDAKVMNYYGMRDYDAGIKLVVKRLDSLITTGSFDSSDSNSNTDEPVSLTDLVLRPTSLIATVLVIGLVLLGISQLQKRSYRFTARVHADILAKNYYQDLKAMQPGLSDAAIMANNKEIRAAKMELKKAINEGKKKRPDYYDMNFAFGKNSIIELAENERKLKGSFKNSSIYRRHQTDWFAKSKQVQKASTQFSANDPSPFVLNIFQEWILKIYLFLTNKYLWLFLTTLGIASLGLSFLKNTFIGRISSSILMLFITAIEQIFVNNPVPADLIFYIGLGIIIFSLFAFCWSYRETAQKRIRLNQIVKDYIKDLKEQIDQPISSKEILVALRNTNENPTIVTAKNNLQLSLNGVHESTVQKAKMVSDKSLTLPDYYDFTFAFGEITGAQFLLPGKPRGTLLAGSVYRNHLNDWYKIKSIERDDQRDDDRYGGSSSDGGDSFGGGSFGGGGGTSSW